MAQLQKGANRDLTVRGGRNDSEFYKPHPFDSTFSQGFENTWGEGGDSTPRHLNTPLVEPQFICI